MEKEAFAQKMMVPEIDESAIKFLNRSKFVNEMLPLLEHCYQGNPEHYYHLLNTFHETVPERLPNFSTVLEHMLIYLSGAFAVDFVVEENQQMYVIESLECSLLQHLWHQPKTDEFKRKQLCQHCAEFHFCKYFRFYGLGFKFQLHHTGCQFFIEKIEEEKINPLFY